MGYSTLSQLFSGVVASGDNFALNELSNLYSYAMVFLSSDGSQASPFVVASVSLGSIYYGILFAIIVGYSGNIAMIMAKHGSLDRHQHLDKPQHHAMLLIALLMLTPIPNANYGGVPIGQYLAVRSFVAFSNMADLINKTTSESFILSNDSAGSATDVANGPTGSLRASSANALMQMVPSFECMDQLSLDGYSKRADYLSYVSKYCGLPQSFVSANAQKVDGTTSNQSPQTPGSVSDAFKLNALNCGWSSYRLLVDSKTLDSSNGTVKIVLSKLDSGWPSVVSSFTSCIIAASPAVLEDKKIKPVGEQFWGRGWAKAGDFSIDESDSSKAYSAIGDSLNVQWPKVALLGNTSGKPDDTMATILAFGRAWNDQQTRLAINIYQSGGTDLSNDSALKVATVFGAVKGKELGKELYRMQWKNFLPSIIERTKALKNLVSSVSAIKKTMTAALIAAKASLDASKSVPLVGAATGAAASVAVATLSATLHNISELTIALTIVSFANELPRYAIAFAFITWMVRGLSVFLITPVSLVLTPMADARSLNNIVKVILATSLIPVFTVLFYYAAIYIQSILMTVCYQFTLEKYFNEMSVSAFGKLLVGLVDGDIIANVIAFVTIYTIVSLSLFTFIYKGPDFALSLLGLEGGLERMSPGDVASGHRSIQDFVRESVR